MAGTKLPLRTLDAQIKESFYINAAGDTCVRVCGILSTSPGDPPSENPVTGDSIHINANATTSWVAYPAVAGGVISSIIIECPQSESPKQLFISFDGGTGWKTMEGGSSFVWSPRGSLTQIHIKGSVNTVAFEGVLNRNDP